MADKTLIDQWLDWLLRVRNVRTATIDAYGRTLFAFQEHVSHLPWDAVDAETIEAFMGRKRRGSASPSPATQDRDRVAINMFYRYLQSRRLVEDNPVINVGVPKVANRQPRAIPDDIWQRIWSVQMHAEDRVWLGLGCFAGLRRRELVTVAPSNFDLSMRTINHMERKGGGTYPVEYGELATVIAQGLPQVLPNLEAWLADVEWLVTHQAERSEPTVMPFSTPASELTRFRMSLEQENVANPAVINKRFASLLGRAGLPRNLYSPHALRHTCATNLMRCGVPLEIAADQLSHASIETTRRYLQTGGQLGQWRRAQ